MVPELWVCCVCWLWHTHRGLRLAGSCLGEKKLPAKKVGENAATMLLSNLAHGGCCDHHLLDQLVVFMALAQGTSRVLCHNFEDTPDDLHTVTALHVVQHVCGARVRVSDVERDGKTLKLLEVDGIGLVNCGQV